MAVKPIQAQGRKLMTVETNQGLSAHELLEDPNSPIVVIGQILCIIIPLVIWFIPLPIEPATQHALAITGFMVVAWITRAMDYALAGMVGCFLFWRCGLSVSQSPSAGLRTTQPGLCSVLFYLE